MSESEVDMQEQIRKVLLPLVLQDDVPDDDISKSIGSFLYYHNRIERNIENLVLSLVPELSYYFENKQLRYEDKLLLLKSFVENSGDIQIFNLLKKLNVIRNKIAHNEYSDEMFDTDELIKIFLGAFAFYKEPNVLQKLETVGKTSKITILLKCVMLTSKMMDLLAATEKFGKEHPKGLGFFSKLQTIANEKVYKRFRTLMLQFQTLKSGEEINEQEKGKKP